MWSRLLVSALCLCWPLGVRADILIGQTTGLTGNSAANVKETGAGARLWLDAVNKKGGIGGQRIELISLDDKGDTALASQNARKLIEERKVIALFMVRGTPQNEAILPLLEQYGIPLIAPSTGAMLLHSPIKKYVFNVRSSYQDEAERAIVQLASMGVSRIAVLKTQDSFGTDTAQGAERGFASTKLTPAFVASFDKAKPDFQASVGGILASNAQAVMVLGTGTAVVKATEEIRKAGSQATIVTLSNNASTGFVRDLGKLARGVVVTQVFPSERALGLPMIREATDLLRANGGGELSPAMIEGYAAAKVLVEALRRSGARPTSPSLLAALEGMSNYDLGGVAVHFSSTSHSGVKFTDLSVVDGTGHFRR